MFEYLKPFVSQEPLKGSKNWFKPIAQADIVAAERSLGGNLPVSLKDFYKTIGAGFLREGKEKSDESDFVINRIVGPRSAVGYIVEPEEYFDNGCPTGYIPVFDIGDRVYFFAKYGTKDEGIYSDALTVVAESFEQFIEKLYFESITFYENI